MKIASRNVNGIRAILWKGFTERVKASSPDIICLQEVKALANQIPPELRFYLPEYTVIWHQWMRPWYAGTAILYRSNTTKPSSEPNLDTETELTEDGRLTQLNFTYNDQEIALLNFYFPNGGPRADGTPMLPSKLKFYEKYIAYIKELEKAEKLVISTGDFNVCHHPIDIARPEANKDSIGFLPIERAEMDKLENEHFIDVFRHFNPTLADQYTWRSYRGGARERNVWWRLDYFRVSEKILPLVKSITHQTQVQGSDHCPIMLEI